MRTTMSFATMPRRKSLSKLSEGRR